MIAHILCRLVPIAVASLALTPAIAQTGSNALPPYTPAYEPRTVDERGLWMEADEDERGLRDSPLVIRDEALNEYVHGVLCRAVGDDRCKGVRIYILEIPAFNASMAPNGTMRVWSGLLLRVRNEAELAAVLGHEFAHFELRHTLAAFKHQRTASDLFAWAGVIGGLTNTNVSLLQWSLVGSIFRFSRAQEEQADRLSFQYLASSPYPTSAEPDIWEHIMAEADATAIGRKQNPHQRYVAGFFDSHPTSLNRAVYLREAERKVSHGGDARGSAYRQAVGKFLPLFLSDQVKRNDFGGTEYLLGQLASTSGWTGDLLFARAELYRLRGNPRDLVSAAQLYSDAIKAGYSAPEARRGLGLSLMRSGQVTDAKSALTEYLRLKPDASDAKAINALLAN
jgi:beta-barrel assembly-enhancing protease